MLAGPAVASVAAAAGWSGAVAVAHILCPIDRSPISRRAFDYAVALSQWARARLTVLEVIDVTPPASAAAIPEGLFVPDDLREGVRQELTVLVRSAASAGVAADVRIDEGRVAERILHAAADSAADLIVMGTHGRSGVQRLVLGSVAEKVVRQADCPVLTVPPGDQHAPSAERPFEVILCPTDFSDVSAEALAVATRFAGESRASLLLLHVVEWPFSHTVGPDPVTALRESLVAQAGRDLAPLVPHARRGVPAADALVRVGHPASQIVAIARERSIDLIVMGVSGRGAVDLAVLGSTAHRILREACCPVLTVRRAAGASPRDQSDHE
jgi:nucleotide-binding universal stress UspA family protein